MKASFNAGDNEETFEGTYTLDGDNLKGKIGGRESQTSRIEISEEEMTLKYKGDKEVTLKRMK